MVTMAGAALLVGLGLVVLARAPSGESAEGGVASAVLPAIAREGASDERAAPRAELWVVSSFGCTLESDGRALGAVKRFEMQVVAVEPGEHEFRCVSPPDRFGEVRQWSERSTAWLGIPHVLQVSSGRESPADRARRVELVDDTAEQRLADQTAAAQRAGFHVDPPSGLAWAEHDNGDKVNWLEARDYCAALSTGGFEDWRLPTHKECLGIQGQMQGAVRIPVRAGDRLWTSSRQSADSRTMIVFASNEGPIFAPISAARARALCVRGASAEPDAAEPPPSQVEIDEFMGVARREAAEKQAREASRAEYAGREATAARQGFAADETTGLIWPLRDSGRAVTRDEAETYCADLDEAGFRDWRLPTLDELETLYVPWQDKMFRNQRSLRLPIELTAWAVWSAAPVERDAPRPGTPPNSLLQHAWIFRFNDCKRSAPDCQRERVNWAPGTPSRAQALCVRP